MRRTLFAPGRLLIILSALVALPLALDAAAARAAGSVERVRYWTAPDHTRIVVDLTRPPRFEDFTLEDPARIVLNISSAHFQSRVKPFEIGDGTVERVRVNTLSSGVAQVVLDLTEPRDYRVFVLDPSHDRKHRLVIDVERPESRAEVERRRKQAAALKANRTTIVMVDPGHGGEDPGAIGPSRTEEKKVCLQLAIAIRDELNRRSGFRAFLTRDGDYYVSLRRRTELARQHQADFFISIHANASANRKVRGTEVYFLSLRGASDEGARDVARRENTAHAIDGLPVAENGEVGDIFQDLMHTADLDRSSLLADSVIDHLREERSLHIRGVKQAGFDVLKTAGMPSLLVETAFVSNLTEVKMLRDRGFHSRFARRLVDGVCGYVELEAPLTGRTGD